MKKGEKKVIKNEDKPDEVVIAEKVIDTRPKIDSSTNYKNILAISSAVYSLEEKQKQILIQINKICVRLGLSKI
tara:strand:- start:1500 stop:1721 length:222 start_codon:yes stop_codon:yes gene_type:complete